MNDKEKELWRVIDNVIKCCAIELPDGRHHREGCDHRLGEIGINQKIN